MDPNDCPPALEGSKWEPAHCKTPEIRARQRIAGVATKVGQATPPWDGRPDDYADRICVSGFRLREALDVDRLRSRGFEIPRPAPKRLVDLLNTIERSETGWWYEPPSESAEGRWCLGPALARALGLGGPRLPGGSSGSSSGAVSAWARSRGVAIGQIATGPTENRAALDRSDIRWRSLKRDVAAEQLRRGADAPSSWVDFRREFLESFEAWRRFYSNSIDNVAGDLWPISDLGIEIERWDATLEAYRSRYRELADREPSSPTDSSTAPRTPLGPPDTGIGDAITWIAIAAIVIGIAWWFSSASTLAPRLVGAGSSAVPT